MRAPTKFLGTVVLSAIAMLTSCGGHAGGSGLPTSAPIISPQPASIPAGTSVTFTASEPALWNLVAFAYASEGTLTLGPIDPTLPGYSQTAQYTAPATPPIWTGAGEGNVQGTASLSAATPGEAANGDYVILSNQITFVITTPSVTVNVSPATATVALNATLQFQIYAVGNVNNALTLEVNGVVGGSSATGTIAHPANQFPDVYTYTAPSTMPMSGSAVTILAVSQADTSKTATAVITLTP